MRQPDSGRPRRVYEAAISILLCLSGAALGFFAWWFFRLLEGWG